MLCSTGLMGADSRRIVPIFITIDPERDTQKLMKDYVGNFGPTIEGLTGTPAQIDAVARAYRVYYQKVPPKDQLGSLGTEVQFFGHVAIDGATQVMTVTLKDWNDTALWSTKIEPKVG